MRINLDYFGGIEYILKEIEYILKDEVFLSELTNHCDR